MRPILIDAPLAPAHSASAPEFFMNSTKSRPIVVFYLYWVVPVPVHCFATFALAAGGFPRYQKEGLKA
jgi:hypothetical protein